jgi:hypothetical protein
VAVILVALVVVFTGRVIVTALSVVGRGRTEVQQGARARSEATVWVQSTTEYIRKIGFAAMNVSPPCAAGPTVPCEYWISVTPPSGPFAQAPALPASFSCGHVLLSDWDGAGGVNPDDLRLVTIEIFRGTGCPTGPSDAPFLQAHTGVAR